MSKAKTNIDISTHDPKTNLSETTNTLQTELLKKKPSKSFILKKSDNPLSARKKTKVGFRNPEEYMGCKTNSVKNADLKNFNQNIQQLVVSEVTNSKTNGQNLSRNVIWKQPINKKKIYCESYNNMTDLFEDTTQEPKEIEKPYLERSISKVSYDGNSIKIHANKNLNGSTQKKSNITKIDENDELRFELLKSMFTDNTNKLGMSTVLENGVDLKLEIAENCKEKFPENEKEIIDELISKIQNSKNLKKQLNSLIVSPDLADLKDPNLLQKKLETLVHNEKFLDEPAPDIIPQSLLSDYMPDDSDNDNFEKKAETAKKLKKYNLDLYNNSDIEAINTQMDQIVKNQNLEQTKLKQIQSHMVKNLNQKSPVKKNQDGNKSIKQEMKTNFKTEDSIRSNEQKQNPSELGRILKLMLHSNLTQDNDDNIDIEILPNKEGNFEETLSQNKCKTISARNKADLWLNKNREYFCQGNIKGTQTNKKSEAEEHQNLILTKRNTQTKLENSITKKWARDNEENFGDLNMDALKNGKFGLKLDSAILSDETSNLLKLLPVGARTDNCRKKIEGCFQKIYHNQHTKACEKGMKIQKSTIPFAINSEEKFEKDLFHLQKHIRYTQNLLLQKTNIDGYGNFGEDSEDHLEKLDQDKQNDNEKKKDLENGEGSFEKGDQKKQDDRPIENDQVGNDGESPTVSPSKKRDTNSKFYNLKMNLYSKKDDESSNADIDSAFKKDYEFDYTKGEWVHKQGLAIYDKDNNIVGYHRRVNIEANNKQADNIKNLLNFATKGMGKILDKHNLNKNTESQFSQFRTGRRKTAFEKKKSESFIKTGRPGLNVGISIQQPELSRIKSHTMQLGLPGLISQFQQKGSKTTEMINPGPSYRQPDVSKMKTPKRNLISKTSDKKAFFDRNLKLVQKRDKDPFYEYKERAVVDMFKKLKRHVKKEGFQKLEQLDHMYDYLQELKQSISIKDMYDLLNHHKLLEDFKNCNIDLDNIIKGQKVDYHNELNMFYHISKGLFLNLNKRISPGTEKPENLEDSHSMIDHTSPPKNYNLHKTNVFELSGTPTEEKNEHQTDMGYGPSDIQMNKVQSGVVFGKTQDIGNERSYCTTDNYKQSFYNSHTKLNHIRAKSELKLDRLRGEDSSKFDNNLKSNIMTSKLKLNKEKVQAKTNSSELVKNKQSLDQMRSQAKNFQKWLEQEEFFNTGDLVNLDKEYIDEIRRSSEISQNITKTNVSYINLQKDYFDVTLNPLSSEIANQILKSCSKKTRNQILMKVREEISRSDYRFVIDESNKNDKKNWEKNYNDVKFYDGDFIENKNISGGNKYEADV